MKFAGGLVKHLGLQMYAGAVPSIAELISNAWDADAKGVWVTFPFDQKFDDNSKIIVRDIGSGMSFDDCDGKYLVLGRNRRKDDGTTTPCGRKFHGHKGIGKLAGFGIANRITVRTVKDHHVTKFLMDFEEIQKYEFGGDYHPTILNDEDEITTEANGTTITLEGIKLARAVSQEDFIRSMSRRFAVMSDDFKVWINDVLLTKFSVETRYRFPDDLDKAEGTIVDDEGWGIEKVDGNEVKWWIGFTEKPLQDEESMGVSVLVNDKLAQTPWFFGLIHGTKGQLGMPYMVGEIKADYLDEHIEVDKDYVATSRDRSMWEHPGVMPLKEWGLEKVKKYLGRRIDYINRDNTEAIENNDPLQQAILTLPEEVQPQAREAVNKVKQITTLDREEVVDLATFMVDSLHNKHLLTLIHQINAASPGDKERIFKLTADWSVVDAICLSIVIKGRVGIIEKFESLLRNEAKEKPDMHEMLKTHPWLIEPGMDYYRYEKELDEILVSEFHSNTSGDGHGKRKPDFFCLQSANKARVVEIKRPGIKAGKKELDQIFEYVHFLREHSRNNSDPQFKLDVDGVLIVSEIDPHRSETVKTLAQTRIYVWDWDTILRRAKNLYREYFDLVVERGPRESPVIKALTHEEILGTN